MTLEEALTLETGDSIVCGECEKYGCQPGVEVKVHVKMLECGCKNFRHQGNTGIFLVDARNCNVGAFKGCAYWTTGTTGKTIKLVKKASA